ncbi:MAG: hypothetical protein AB7U20_00620 [Planctomycetaceae bacterium]
MNRRRSEDRGKRIGDVPAATAILDRFRQDVELIQITGESDRLRGRAADSSKGPSDVLNDGVEGRLLLSRTERHSFSADQFRPPQPLPVWPRVIVGSPDSA